jgi:uncharacterized membrane protein YphA (DoxX/SURF4 family)
MKRLRRLCALITGFVFFISGILKVLDPVGAGLVMKEYFEFLHIGFISPASKILGTGFALLETLLGAALMTGVWRKSASIAAMALQGVFTLLTLALVIFNPEMDCGCFGEAIHLTHLETFIKNIILCVLLAAASFPLNNIGEPLKKKYVSFGLVSVSVVLFSIYSLLYIPIIDFTEFRQTAQLQAADAYADIEGEQYEAVFIYEKDGQQESFDLEHLPDSTWNFVRTETVLREDFEDNSINLSFYDDEGEYMDRLAAVGNVMVISVYDPDWKKSRWEETAQFISRATAAGYTPIVLTASTDEDLDILLGEIDEESRDIIENCLFYSDYKTLLTMNRSNGGAVWFSDGFLIRKWAQRALPDEAQLKADIDSDVTEALIEKSTTGNIAFQGFLLYVFAVMLLL